MRKWAQTLNYVEIIKFDYNPKVENDKKASMKYLFLARFAKEGRTLEAAYNAWSILTFDPNKDDIEQFVSKVEDLAKKLGYNKDAQVMAMENVLPRDVYGICMTYKNLKDLKNFLIELFSNQKMKKLYLDQLVYPVTQVFSIGQHVENNVVNPMAADVGKIQQDINAIQVSFNKISSVDFRNRSNSKPWKPEVTPPRRRGGFSRGRGGRQFDNIQQNDRFKNNDSNGSQNGNKWSEKWEWYF